MQSKIKNTLSDIQTEIERLQGIEESLFLVDLFYDLTKIIDYCAVDKFEINYSVDTVPHFFISYHDGYSINNERLSSVFKYCSKTPITPTLMQNFGKRLTALEKQNIKKLNPFTTETTVEEFLSQFDTKHMVNFLNCTLEKKTNTNNTRLKICTWGKALKLQKKEP